MNNKVNIEIIKEEDEAIMKIINKIVDKDKKKDNN